MAGAVRARVLISGRVQGVFFRAETARRAAERGVSGWVRNLLDGGVEAWFEGSPEAVESLISWCRRGPSGASVDSVDVNWGDPEGLAGFRVRG